MDKKELIKELHKIFGYGSKNSKVEEILEKTKSYGLAYKKAIKYLKQSKKGQDDCRSDSAYWGWASDIALAKVLCAITIFNARGKKEFPSLGYKKGVFLMDKQANLEDWAHQLNANHKHVWRWKTLQNSSFYRCKVCKDKRYNFEPKENYIN